jgi:putative acetyltransferase
MFIRETTLSDLDAILAVEYAAFGRDDVVGLTRDLLRDPTAIPMISLLAFEGDRPVGHILFTSAHLEPSAPSVAISILAPLAVIPEEQRKGVGGGLIEYGLRVLSDAGVGLVFVLGHPDYYPRHGFAPAGCRGFDAPYPIPAKDADAWMVRELRPGLIGNLRGTVLCAEAMDRPEHWRE